MGVRLRRDQIQQAQAQFSRHRHHGEGHGMPPLLGGGKCMSAQGTG